MKLYKEMLRKLAAVGLPLLAVTMAYTLVEGGSNCFGAYYLQQSTSAISQVFVLRYYVFSGVLFALYGFSFLFTRPGSDVYHSLPVKRTGLFTSVLLATATWMGATILLNELEMLAIYLISGCPFVPVYIPLSSLYYFVGSMLVFSAAAIGCALSGTLITALASTGIVLLLPRYVQFLFARGIVERVPIIGWLDFGALLDPTTNAATGILAMQLRNIYNGHLISMAHILYSLVPLAIMLAVGLWLFQKRPSEIAQKNGGNKIWTTICAALLAFAVMLPITRNNQRLFSTYGFVLIAAALFVFIVYQLIVTIKIKKVVFTLPYFLLAVMAVLAVSGLIQTAADSMLKTTPAADEIASVTFLGYDQKSGDPTYTTLQIREIAFDDEETKTYVAQALRDAVAEIESSADDYNYEYNRFNVIEPVEIKLSGGGTIKRTIEFADVDELNALRMQNEAFLSAVKEFPPMGSVQYLLVETDFTPEENRAILETYVAEAQANGISGGYYYRSRTVDLLPNGNSVAQEKNQSLMGITLAGYVGGSRYSDGYSIRLSTPETASLLMRTYNAYIEDLPADDIGYAMNLFDAGLAGQNDSMSFTIMVVNYVNEDGLTVQDATSFYLNKYALSSESEYDTVQIDYMHQFADSLRNAVLTDDPNGLFIRLDWHYRFGESGDEDYQYVRPTAYLHFTNEADEQEFLSLYKEWEDMQRAL